MLLRVTRTRSLHSRHAFASHFGALVRFSGRQIWPPPRPSISAAFAATLVPAGNSADWANNYERRAAAQQREGKYMADYYARTTREQEERENREARERFVANQRKNST